jgi:hypothetical protein
MSDKDDLDFLADVKNGQVPVTVTNVGKALKHRRYVQILDRQNMPMYSPLRLADIGGFRLTHRGVWRLDSAKEQNGSVQLPFNKADPPLPVRHWLSAFQRALRNCPTDIVLVADTDEIRVLAKDTEGTVKDDDGHCIAKAKVPWLPAK